MYARFRPIRSPILLLIRMNAADTSASSAIADWTPLAVVLRSLTTAEIDTFISDVSTTRTNIAAESSSARRELKPPSAASCSGDRRVRRHAHLSLGAGLVTWPAGRRLAAPSGRPSLVRARRSTTGDGRAGMLRAP